MKVNLTDKEYEVHDSFRAKILYEIGLNEMNEKGIKSQLYTTFLYYFSMFSACNRDFKMSIDDLIAEFDKQPYLFKVVADEIESFKSKMEEDPSKKN